MLKYYKIIFYLYLFSTFKLYSSPLLEIKNRLYNTVIGENLEYYIDIENNLNINNLFNNKNKIIFKNINIDVPNFGYTSATVWFRIILNKSEDIEKKLYLNIQNSNIDNIEIYEIFESDEKDNIIKKTILGDHLKINDKELFNREYLFIPLINHINREEIYFKVNSSSSIIDL